MTSATGSAPAYDASAPVRALVIEPGSDTAHVQRVLANDGDEMRRMVDGYLDALTLRGLEADGAESALWINEEGLLQGLAENPAASAIAYGAGLLLGGPLVGTAVLTGLVWGGPGGGQVAADVTDEMLSFARAQGVTVVEDRDGAQGA